jgi:hypothetical protein
MATQMPLIVSLRFTTQVAPEPEVGAGVAVGEGVGVAVGEGVTDAVAVGSALSVGMALLEASLLGTGLSASALPMIDWTTGASAVITGPPPTMSSAASAATATRRAQGRDGAGGAARSSEWMSGSPIG